MQSNEVASESLMSLREIAAKLIAPAPRVFIEEDLTKPKLKKHTVFFNEGFSVQHKQTSALEAEGFEVKRKLPRRAPTALTPASDLSALAQLTPPPPGFFSAQKTNGLLPDSVRNLSSGAKVKSHSVQAIDFNVLSKATDASPPILEELPAKSLSKRLERCQYEGEEVIGARKPACIKFYNLRGRFGFLTLDDGTDVFFCEDDILVSGYPLKQFKDEVSRKANLALVCDVIRYESRGEEKLKAANIEFAN
jgi:hypothetical protein